MLQVKSQYQKKEKQSIVIHVDLMENGYAKSEWVETLPFSIGDTILFEDAPHKILDIEVHRKHQLYSSDVSLTIKPR